jgi:CRP-like cAMP-binding protein
MATPIPRADFLLLAQAPLFEGFTEAELSRFAAYVHVQSYTADQVIIWEGSTHRSLRVVLRGTTVVTKMVKGEVESVLARMSPGGQFGELSLIDNRPAAGTVMAETACAVAEVPWEHLQRLQSEDPALFGKLAWAMLQDLTQKLRATNRKVQETIEWGMSALGVDAG